MSIGLFDSDNEVRIDFFGLMEAAAPEIKTPVAQIIEKVDAALSKSNGAFCFIPLENTYHQEAIDTVMGSLQKQQFQIFERYQESEGSTQLWCVQDMQIPLWNGRDLLRSRLPYPEEWLSWNSLKEKISSEMAAEVLMLGRQINEVFREEQRSGFWKKSVPGNISGEVVKIVMDALEEHVRVFKEHRAKGSYTSYVFHVPPVSGVERQ